MQQRAKGWILTLGRCISRVKKKMKKKKKL